MQVGAAAILGSMPESIPDFDLYDALGVSVDADAIAIRAAHREAVRRAHPDAAPDTTTDDAEAKRLNVARDWLVDPARRARYDESRGLVAWTTDAGSTSEEAATPPEPADGIGDRLGRREAIGCLEVGWWLLLILAAALIFGTLLLLVAEH